MSSRGMPKGRFDSWPPLDGVMSIIPREACDAELGKCGSRIAFPGPSCMELSVQRRRLESGLTLYG